MIRNIIKIDESKCDGCGICAVACHEGAIEIIDGKAKLTREDYCDGLGDCLPSCPTGAITFEMREAPAYDEAAVLAHQKAKNSQHSSCSCPGSQAHSFVNSNDESESNDNITVKSHLMQWPIQIKLVPTNAPYLEDAHLLIAADCCSYAYGNFHNDFMKNHVTLIGCPKLDAGDYTEKLAEIISNNNIKSLSIVRMEVPCCSGIEIAAKNALQLSGKFIPWQIHTISINGNLVE